MDQITIQPSDLLTYDDYLECRQWVRKTMIAERKARSVQLTDNIRLAFENVRTVSYQIQEVIYADRVNDADTMASQIACYRHLIPGARELTATLLYEYPDPGEAEHMTAALAGAESTVFLKIGSEQRVFPFVNEDIQGQPLIAPVHYLRFALSEQQVSALNTSATLSIGVAHHTLHHINIEISDSVKSVLMTDIIRD